jgi:hypothetical protein
MWVASAPAANSHEMCFAYSFTFAGPNGVTYAGLLGYRALSLDLKKAPASTDTNMMWSGMGRS